MRQSIKKKILGEIEIYCLLAVMAVWYLTNLVGGLISDEVVYARAGYGLVTLHDRWMTLEHPPMVKYFIGLGEMLFGTTSFGARAPIAIFGLLTVYMTYRLGKLLGNRFTGFISAALLGGTFLFSQFSVMATLDVPLAFFCITLLFITLKCLKSGSPFSPKYSFLIGVLSVAVITSKYYGIFFAIIPLGYLLFERWRKYGLRYQVISSMGFYLAGGVIVFMLVYTPYIFLDTPALGNIGAIIKESWRITFGQLQGGDLIRVGSKDYQYPPFWSYVYWLWEQGGLIYTFGLLISLCYIAYEAIKSEIRNQRIILISFAVIPFLCLSSMTVKFPHYLIPLLPVFAACTVTCLYKLLSMGILKLSFQRSFPSLFAGIALVLVLLTQTTHFLEFRSHPIGQDSGYDRAARIVESYAREHADREVIVASWEAGSLEYYLGDTKNYQIKLPNLRIMYLFYQEGLEDNDAKVEGLINQGKIDMVIDYDPNTRFNETDLYRIIREQAKSVDRIDLNWLDLAIFQFQT